MKGELCPVHYLPDCSPLLNGCGKLSSPLPPPTARELRDWTKGLVPDKGRLPRALIIAWNRTHPDRPFAIGPDPMVLMNPARHKAYAERGGRAKANIVKAANDNHSD